MITISVAQVGFHDFVSIPIFNLVATLNKTQSCYHFILETQIIRPNKKKQFEDGTYQDKYLTDLLGKCNEKYGADMIIGITDLELNEGLLYVSYENNIIISVANWNKFSKEPGHKGLIYMMASSILGAWVGFDPHNKSIGCPSDFCDDTSEIDLGIQKGESLFSIR